MESFCYSKPTRQKSFQSSLDKYFTLQIIFIHLPIAIGDIASDIVQVCYICIYSLGGSCYINIYII